MPSWSASVGNVVAGFTTTLRHLDHMIYHAGAVRRGAPDALVIVDMPFLTYQISEQQALRNCGRVVQRRERKRSARRRIGVESRAPCAQSSSSASRVSTRLHTAIRAHVGRTRAGRGATAAARLSTTRVAWRTRCVLDRTRAAACRRRGKDHRSVSIPTIGMARPALFRTGPRPARPARLNDTFSPKFLKRYATLADDVRGAVERSATTCEQARIHADHSF